MTEVVVPGAGHPPRTAAEGEPPPRVSPRQAVAVAYVAAIFLGAMDNHIVNVALPTLSRDLHASIAATQWTVIGYVLSLAVWIPASGWIGDRVGTKKTFLFALVLFTSGSALCGQSHSLGELIVFRVLQGSGGGMLAPVGTAMLFRSYPPEQRARATRLLALPVLLGPAMAPVVGGLLIEYLSWRWVFYVNVPFGVAVFVMGSLFLVEEKEPTAGRFDIAGFVLAGSGLALLLYATSQGPLHGWGTSVVLGTGVGGIAVLVSFVMVEQRVSSPMLRLGLLGERLFRSINAVTSASTAAFLGCLYLAPIFLQEALHQSPLSSGLTTFVEAIGVVFSSQTVGRLYPRLGPRRMAASGLVGVCLSIAGLVLVGAGTSLWWVRLLMFTMGFANGSSFLSIQAAAFARIAPADTGHGSAIFNANRQTSLAISVAVLSTVVVSVGGSSIAGFHWAFAAAAAMALVGAALALVLVHDEDASATMLRPGSRDGRARGGGRPGRLR